MFIRLVRTSGSSDTEQRKLSLQAWQQNIQSRLKEQKGYLGAVVLAKIDSGEGATITYWQDQAAIESSTSLSNELRANAKSITGRTVSEVETFEVVIVERMGPISVPSFVRSTDIVADPGQLEAGIGLVRDRVYPAVSGQPGFRSLICAVNRQTGRSIVSTTWVSLESLERSEAAVVDLRESTTRSMGATSVKVEKWEAILAEVPAAAGIRH